MTLTLLGCGYVALLLAVVAYIRLRLGFVVTARTALLGWIWVVCGPPHVFYWLAGRLDDATFVRITLCFSLMWLVMLASIEIVRLWTPRQFRRADLVARLWRRMTVAPGYISRMRLAGVCSAGLLFMLLVAVSEHQVGNLIRFVRLAGQTDDVAVFRGTMGGSQLYVYNVFLSSVAPYLCMLLLMRPAPNLRIYTAIRYAFFAATLLGKATLFSRSSMGLFLVQLLVVKALLRDNRITVRRVVGGVLLVLLLVLPAFYHYRADLNNILGYFFDRISLALYYGMIPYFQVIPETAPHGMGRSIPIVNRLFYHGAPYTPPMLMFAQQAGNYYGSYNAGFVAEAWGEFGYPGVFLMSAALAIAASLADLVVFSDGVKTREGAATLVCVVYGVLMASSTAAQTALFSGGLALIPLLTAVLKATAPRVRRASGDGPAAALTESPAPS